MFFSTKICPATLIETLRVSDPVKNCAAKLRKECEDFDFLLENSYSDANDLQYSLNQYKRKSSRILGVIFEHSFSIPEEINSHSTKV